MLVDAEHFRNRLGVLDGAGDTGDYLVTLVKEKGVPKPKAQKPPHSPAPISTFPATVEVEKGVNGNGGSGTPSETTLANGGNDEEKHSGDSALAEEKVA